MSSRSDSGPVTGPSKVFITFFEMLEMKRQLEGIRDRVNSWDAPDVRRKQLGMALVSLAAAGVKTIEEILSD